MTEFIINSDQLEQLIAGIEHETGKEINRVICDGKELPSIIRCKDCKGYRPGELYGWCSTHMTAIPREDGFCAWGKRREE